MLLCPPCPLACCWWAPSVCPPTPMCPPTPASVGDTRLPCPLLPVSMPLGCPCLCHCQESGSKSWGGSDPGGTDTPNRGAFRRSRPLQALGAEPLRPPAQGKAVKGFLPAGVAVLFYCLEKEALGFNTSRSSRLPSAPADAAGHRGERRVERGCAGASAPGPAPHPWAGAHAKAPLPAAAPGPSRWVRSASPPPAWSAFSPGKSGFGAQRCSLTSAVLSSAAAPMPSALARPYALSAA